MGATATQQFACSLLCGLALSILVVASPPAVQFQSESGGELIIQDTDYCSDSDPLALEGSCDPSWTTSSANHNKCRPQLVCVEESCTAIVPGAKCSKDADCGVDDTGCDGQVCGLKRGYGSTWIGMSCINEHCGYLASEGDTCTTNSSCASGSCSVSGLCTGLSVGAPCDPKVQGNPCKSNAFCQVDKTGNNTAPYCAESHSVGEACTGQTLGESSLANIADECVVGSSCNPKVGQCVPEFQQKAGESCSGVIGPRQCNEDLACVEETDGAYMCHKTGPTCNVTSPCPLGSQCMCNGQCLEVSLPSCGVAYEELVKCLQRFRCHNHNLFGFHALQESLCARNCIDRYTEYVCCLAGELKDTDTVVQCPGQTIEVGVSIAIMVAGGVFGLMLGIFVGVLCARRRAAINTRYLALLSALQKQGGEKGTYGAA